MIQALFEAVRQQDMRAMIGGIDADLTWRSTTEQSLLTLLKLRAKDDAAIRQSQSSRHSNSGHESETNPRP